MTTITADRSLDGRGKTITTFVVFEAAEALEEMSAGEVLEVLTDEFEPFESDIATWCRSVGHALLASEGTAPGHRFLIEKGHPIARDSKLAMVISQAGLLDLLSPLGFALGAALEGIDVQIYFQGPAVRVVTRGFRPKMPGWARPFTRFAQAGMTKAGHIPAQEKLSQLHELGARFYVCGGSLEPFKVKPEDFIFDDMPVVEYLTFMSIMDGADINIYV